MRERKNTYTSNTFYTKVHDSLLRRGRRFVRNLRHFCFSSSRNIRKKVFKMWYGEAILNTHPTPLLPQTKTLHEQRLLEKKNNEKYY